MGKISAALPLSVMTPYYPTLRASIYNSGRTIQKSVSDVCILDISSLRHVQIAIRATLEAPPFEIDHHDCIEQETAVLRADREMADVLDHLRLQR